MTHITPRKGLVFVLVGPTAVGKNTLMREALRQIPDLRQLPTATTRAKRNDEEEGREHFFYTEEEFVNLINDDKLLEWQWVHGNRYGIIRETIEQAIENRDDLIADIEVLGASILRQEYPDNAILIFVSPPDRKTLLERIRARGADDEKAIQTRLNRTPFEMKFAAMCRYLIINDDLEKAAQELISIVSAERCRRSLSALTVSAMVLDHARSMVLTTLGGVLPTTSLLPGEMPEQAFERLLTELGIRAPEYIRQPDTPDSGISPTYFSLNQDGGETCLNMVFACKTSTSTDSPSWQWKPVDTVPAAASLKE